VLLPVVAISLVMLILKLNIDPAGPPLELDFRIFKPTGLRTIIPVAGVSQNDMAIFRASDYMEFQVRDDMNDSVALSEDLLQTYLNTPTRFGKHHSRANSMHNDRIVFHTICFSFAYNNVSNKISLFQEHLKANPLRNA